VLLNPAPPSALDEALLAQVNCLVLNETEAQVLTGIKPVDADSCGGAAKALRARGIGVVVLTLGERGAYVFSSEGGFHVPARPVKVVDTTAAGDAFVGGFAVSLVEGRSLGEATRFACAAGTLAVTRLGAQTSIPARAEVEKLLAQTEEKQPVL
jgi:ribokinase